MNEQNYPNDTVLIEYCQKGDRSAFDLLVKKYEKKAYQYAYRLCNGNREDASDVVADAFVRVFMNIKSFRREATFTTWMYRVITNVFLDIQKRERIRAHESLDQMMKLDDGDITRQVEDDKAGPLEIAETNERDAALMNAISKLPEYQRAMILMYHIEGLSYDEIAEVINLPLGTVKSRLNRARLALKEIMTPQKELFEL